MRNSTFRQRRRKDIRPQVRQVLTATPKDGRSNENMVLLLLRFVYCTGRIAFTESSLKHHVLTSPTTPDLPIHRHLDRSDRKPPKPATHSTSRRGETCFPPKRHKLGCPTFTTALPSLSWVKLQHFSGRKSSFKQAAERFRVVACLLCLTWFATSISAATTCAPTTFEGEVRAGEAFQHPISPTLDFKLEAVPNGWIIRVLPHGSSTSRFHDPQDLAELANPPYRSPTPILLSTGYSFRAQDAIAWNPRTFHFFTTAAQRRIAEEAYQATLRDPNHPSAGAALYTVLPQAHEAEFRILDAEIAGGTANQSPAAAAVASHFAQTAHRVRADLPPTALGQILQLRFRVTVTKQDTDLCKRNKSPQSRTHP